MLSIQIAVSELQPGRSLAFEPFAVQFAARTLDFGEVCCRDPSSDRCILRLAFALLAMFALPLPLMFWIFVMHLDCSFWALHDADRLVLAFRKGSS